MDFEILLTKLPDFNSYFMDASCHLVYSNCAMDAMIHLLLGWECNLYVFLLDIGLQVQYLSRRLACMLDSFFTLKFCRYVILFRRQLRWSLRNQIHFLLFAFFRVHVSVIALFNIEVSILLDGCEVFEHLNLTHVTFH